MLCALQLQSAKRSDKGVSESRVYVTELVSIVCMYTNKEISI